MTAYEALITYVVAWWLVLFMVLPFGAAPPDAPEAGHATSAPAKPRVLLKMAITTLLAGAVTAFVHLVVTSGWISLRP